MQSHEEQLMLAAQRGDRDAFGALYDTYINRLYAFVLVRVHHREIAEDLVSTSFLKALDGIAGFHGGNVGAWLYRITRNVVIDHFRTHRPTEELDRHDRVDEGEQATVLDHRHLLETVRATLATFPEAQREILILRAWDGLSYREIADLLGKTEAACKVAFSRALAKLRSTLPFEVGALLLFLLAYGPIIAGSPL